MGSEQLGYAGARLQGSAGAGAIHALRRQRHSSFLRLGKAGDDTVDRTSASAVANFSKLGDGNNNRGQTLNGRFRADWRADKGRERKITSVRRFLMAYRPPNKSPVSSNSTRSATQSVVLPCTLE